MASFELVLLAVALEGASLLSNSASDMALAMALQDDGKIVVAGQTDNGKAAGGTDNGIHGWDFALARYQSDAPPRLSIDDVTVSEGNSGAVSALFTLALSTASSETITVQYATANGTATAGSDYTAVSGTLTFHPGGTSKTISVPVTGDTIVEADETFFVAISGAANATITDDEAVGTIVNDDSPNLSVNDLSVTEGNTGTVNTVFTVTLSATSNQTVSVEYGTAEGSATAGSDYTAAAGTLTFNPGETSKTITVAVKGDTMYEPNESFTVNLSNPTNAVVADDQGLGTITNNDSQPAIGSDYTATSGTLTFAPGETSKTITVMVNGDKIKEANEAFYVNLSSATNASIADAQAVATILNDDNKK